MVLMFHYSLTYSYVTETLKLGKVKTHFMQPGYDTTGRKNGPRQTKEGTSFLPT